MSCCAVMKGWATLFSQVVARAFYGNKNAAAPTTPASHQDDAAVQTPAASPSSTTPAAAAGETLHPQQSAAASLPPPGTAAVASRPPPHPPSSLPPQSHPTPPVPLQTPPAPPMASAPPSAARDASHLPHVPSSVTAQSLLGSPASAWSPSAPVTIPSPGERTPLQSAPATAGAGGWSRPQEARSQPQSLKSTRSEGGQERGRGPGRGRGWGRGREGGGRGGSHEGSGEWEARRGQPPHRSSASASPSTPNTSAPRPKRPGSWRQWPQAISRSLSPRPSARPPPVDSEGFTLVQRRSKPARPSSSQVHRGSQAHPKYEEHYDPESGYYLGLEGDFVLEEEDFPALESAVGATGVHHSGVSRPSPTHKRPGSHESGNQKPARSSSVDHTLLSPQAHNISIVPQKEHNKPRTTQIDPKSTPTAPTRPPVEVKGQSVSSDMVGVKPRSEQSEAGVAVLQGNISEQDLDQRQQERRMFGGDIDPTDTDQENNVSRNDLVLHDKMTGHQGDSLRQPRKEEEEEELRRTQEDLASEERLMDIPAGEKRGDATPSKQDDTTHPGCREAIKSKTSDSIRETSTSKRETKSKKSKKRNRRKTGKSSSQDVEEALVICEEIQQMDDSVEPRVTEAMESDYQLEHYQAGSTRTRGPPTTTHEGGEDAAGGTQSESVVGVREEDGGREEHHREVGGAAESWIEVGDVLPEDHDVIAGGSGSGGEDITFGDLETKDNHSKDMTEGAHVEYMTAENGHKIEDKEIDYDFVHMEDVTTGGSSATDNPEDMNTDYSHVGNMMVEMPGDYQVTASEANTRKESSSPKDSHERKKHIKTRGVSNQQESQPQDTVEEDGGTVHHVPGVDGQILRPPKEARLREESSDLNSESGTTQDQDDARDRDKKTHTMVDLGCPPGEELYPPGTSPETLRPSGEADSRQESRIQEIAELKSTLNENQDENIVQEASNVLVDERKRQGQRNNTPEDVRKVSTEQEYSESHEEHPVMNFKLESYQEGLKDRQECPVDKQMESEGTAPCEIETKRSGERKHKHENSRHENMSEENDGTKSKKRGHKHRTRTDGNCNTNDRSYEERDENIISKKLRSEYREEEGKQTEGSVEGEMSMNNHTEHRQEEKEHSNNKRRHSKVDKQIHKKEDIDQEDNHKGKGSKKYKATDSHEETLRDLSLPQKQIKDEEVTDSESVTAVQDPTAPNKEEEIAALMNLISQKKDKIRSLQLALHKSEPKEPQAPATSNDQIEDQEKHTDSEEDDSMGSRRLSPIGGEGDLGMLWVFEAPVVTSTSTRLNQRAPVAHQQESDALSVQEDGTVHRSLSEQGLECRQTEYVDVTEDGERTEEKKERKRRRKEAEKMKRRKKDRYTDADEGPDILRDTAAEGRRESQGTRAEEREKNAKIYKDTDDCIQISDEPTAGAKEISETQIEMEKMEERKRQEELELERQIAKEGKERKRKKRGKAKERESRDEKYDVDPSNLQPEASNLDEEELKRKRKEEKGERKRRKRKEKERLKQIQASIEQDSRRVEETEDRRERRRRRKEREEEELERQKLERKRRDERNLAEEAPAVSESWDAATAAANHPGPPALHTPRVLKSPSEVPSSTVDASVDLETTAEAPSSTVEAADSVVGLDAPAEDLETPAEAPDTALEIPDTTVGAGDTPEETSDSYTCVPISPLALERMKRINELLELRCGSNPVEETVDTALESVDHVNEPQSCYVDEMMDTTEMKSQGSYVDDDEKESLGHSCQQTEQRRRRRNNSQDVSEETGQAVRRRRRREEDRLEQEVECSVAEPASGPHDYNFLKKFEEIVAERRKRRSKRIDESEDRMSQTEENPVPRRRTRKTGSEDSKQVQDSRREEENDVNQSTEDRSTRRRRRRAEDGSSIHEADVSSKDYEEVFARRRQRRSRRLEGGSSQLEEDRHSAYHSHDSRPIDGVTEADKQYEEILERRRRIRRSRYAEMHKGDDQREGTTSTSSVIDVATCQLLEEGSAIAEEPREAETQQTQPATSGGPQHIPASLEHTLHSRRSSPQSDSDSSDSGSSDSGSSDSDSSDSDSSDTDDSDSEVNVPGAREQDGGRETLDVDPELQVRTVDLCGYHYCPPEAPGRLSSVAL